MLDAVAIATKDHPQLRRSVADYWLDGSPQIDGAYVFYDEELEPQHEDDLVPGLPAVVR